MSAHVLVLMEGLPYPFDVRVRAQVAALRGAGHRVTVVGPAGYGHDAPEEHLEGVRVLRFALSPSSGRAVGYLREYVTAWLAVRRLVRRVHREDPFDLVLVCNPPDELALITRRLRRRGVKVVFDYREICPELYEAKFGRRGLLHRLLLAGERRALRSADVVITVSDACAELARERGGVAPDRILLVGNGPDPERIYEVPARPELRAGHRHLVLWLGAMSRQEGLETLIEAADQMVHRHGRRDVLFALIGPGDAHGGLRQEVRRRGLEDCVMVSGAVDDDLVRAYMSTADICVGVDAKGPMNDRAAMRKILEYMTVGRAVVQFPLTQMQRICGDTTVYARDADAGDLADRLEELISDPSRCAALGAAARIRVHEGLMWPQQVPELLRAVTLALEERPAPQTLTDTGLAAQV